MRDVIKLISDGEKQKRKERKEKKGLRVNDDVCRIRNPNK